MDISTDDPEFLTRAERWISERGEIPALFRYSHAAGDKDFFFFEFPVVFRAALRRAGSQTSVIVFRQRQLPLRGTVDEDLIRAARELIPDDAEFLFLDLGPQEGGWSYHRSGVGHRELEESLNEIRGHRVALGCYPPWDYDSEDVMEAIVPDSEGVVRRGCY